MSYNNRPNGRSKLDYSDWFEYQGLEFGVPGMVVEIPNLGIPSTRYGRKNIKVVKYFKSPFEEKTCLWGLCIPCIYYNVWRNALDFVIFQGEK